MLFDDLDLDQEPSKPIEKPQGLKAPSTKAQNFNPASLLDEYVDFDSDNSSLFSNIEIEAAKRQLRGQ
ncbi:MAG TPA: hypothetical protein V6D19_15290 [Stenomitos sp.]